MAEPHRVGPVVEVTGLTFGYAGRDLVTGLSFTLRAGESLVVAGRSGSGKTTLLSLVMGLVKPSAGTITISGQPVTGVRASTVARIRRDHVGMVFQSGELLPELTPVENVALAALLGGQDPGCARERATGLLERFGVPVEGTRTANLSGGERQRVALARALVNGPDLVLADEPTGSLDRQTRDGVCEVLFDLPRRDDCALVVVTHDEDVATRADRVVELIDGRFVDRPVVAR